MLINLDQSKYSIPKVIFAMLAKIIGNVRFYLLCALLNVMRFRSKRYLCWQGLPGACWVVGSAEVQYEA
jgi:hypothetical protein